MSGWARSALWAFGLFVVAMLAYFTGEDRYPCDGGDCDLRSLSGLGWAVGASLIYVFVACGIELTLLHTRNKREHELERIRNGQPPR